ncbi:MAG: N-acetyl-gamma-glutamyl-phosphate reductase [Opitutales bacterium]|nr:N-acetyl-gamma-glutamyl-phosphate reductase [Opitutales bacterium]
MKTIKCGIIGASGYSGELLVKLLARHPGVDLVLAASRKMAGRKVADALPTVRGYTGDLNFVAPDMENLLSPENPVEVFFLALPHGVSAEFAEPLLQAGKRVIDLSADFRLFSPELYEEYYGEPHPRPDLLPATPYVLPEVSSPVWKEANLIACPGCYPTSILLPLLPLVKEGVVSGDDLIINSLSGVSGAGKKLAENFLFCERSESVKAYGIPRHRHLSEIEEQLGLAADREIVVQFSPHLAPMRRGIATTIVSPAGESSLEALYEAWKKFYSGKPMVSILGPAETPDTAHVVGTNRIEMAAAHDPRTNRFVITSAEDNLMKGAGGQAVQIFNLWYDFPEETGLL